MILTTAWFSRALENVRLSRVMGSGWSVNLSEETGLGVGELGIVSKSFDLAFS